MKDIETESFSSPSPGMTVADVVTAHDHVDLSTAYRFLWRFKKILAPDDPQSALLSALRSGWISSTHEVLSPIELRGRTYQTVTTTALPPQLWVASTALNLMDNSINSENGAPLCQIKVSKYELYAWLESRVRTEPNWVFDDFEAFCAETLEFVFPQDSEVIEEVKLKGPPPNRGGRPMTYNWPAIIIHFMANAVWAEGSITPDSKKKEIGRRLSASAAVIDCDRDLDPKYATDEYGGIILDALRAALSTVDGGTNSDGAGSPQYS